MVVRHAVLCSCQPIYTSRVLGTNLAVGCLQAECLSGHNMSRAELWEPPERTARGLLVLPTEGICHSTLSYCLWTTAGAVVPKAHGL